MDEIKIQDGATEKRFTITKMSAYAVVACVAGKAVKIWRDALK